MQATLIIDLDTIAENWRALDAMTACETGAVVKADAYGLGVTHVAPALWNAGARTFFVALAEEGLMLRQVLGVDAQIFVFSGYMQNDDFAVSKGKLVPLLNSAEQAARYFDTHPDLPFGVQIDTGMNRLGMEADEFSAVDFPRAPDLIISHLACADVPEHPQNLDQLRNFKTINNFDCPASLSATGGILLGDAFHHDITRPGIGLYGGQPFADAKPVVTLSLPIIQTRIVETGESVGYGATWIAKRKSKIATVAAGYADGLIRAMGNSGILFAGNTPCPIVGRVSMDLITVDMTDVPDIPETLEILNDTQTIDVLADAAGTIGYEILTSLGGRYARRYIGG